MMENSNIYNKLWLLSLVCLLGTACADDLQIDDFEDGSGLVMQLQMDGNAVLTPYAFTRSIDAVPTLNETLVKYVDVFFSEPGSNAIYCRFHADMGEDNLFVLAGADWKDMFPDSSYQVYVVANLHGYDNPDTPEDETDLSWIATVDQLRALTDTDPEVCHAEGEEILDASGNNNTIYSDKTFLMDGSITWTPPDTDEATITVDLKRAAAKIVVNVAYSDDFVGENISIVNLRKKVVHYVPQTKVLEEVPYQEMEVMGDAGTSGFSNPDVSNKLPDAGRKDILYAYTYPNQWGDNMERETYLLLNIPYTVGENEEYYSQNYYKVPVRFSSDTDELRLDRNMQYTVNVTIDRKGNEEIDEPVELSPTFNIAEWKSVTINVDNTSPNYLVLSEEYIELHNEGSTKISFFSSSELSNVEIMEAYFINKDGHSIDKIKTEEGSGWWSEDKYEPIKDVCCRVEYDHGTLTGEIRFEGVIPDNVTARYVTLKVTNTDNDPITRTVTIVQYPLEYIMGVPGWYSTRSDFTATWEDQGNEFGERQTVSNDVFESKYYNENNKYIYTYISQGTKFSLRRGWYGPPYTIVSGSSQFTKNNNRMYLVQLTSTNAGYTIARPKIDIVEDADSETGMDIVTAIGDQNNNMVSPAFMLASQLGTVSTTSNWNTAQEHCRKYVEVIKYDNGQPPTRVLSDWRLPTFAELKIIAKYQNEQPDIMDEVLGGARYWSADSYKFLTTDNATEEDYITPEKPDDIYNNGYSDISCFIRCIRDVTPEDLEEFAAHGIR